MTPRLRSVTCLLIVALLDTPAVAAQSRQSELPLPLGRRVRIQPDRGYDVIGNLVGARADTLFVELEPLGDVRGVPLPLVHGIWVSKGMPRRLTLHGAIGGALFLGSVAASQDEHHGRVFVTAALGAFFGALIGHRLHREPWRRIR